MVRKISIKRIINGVVVSYIILLIALFVGQRDLVFRPHGNIDKPSNYALQGYDEVTLQTSDSLNLKAWYSNPKNSKKAILFFIGNADSLDSYVMLFTQLHGAGIAVLAVCYRGYCGNEGSPTEQGLYADGDAALEFLRKEFADENIVAVGRSLGTGVATNLAHKNSLGGLVLISPYTSLPDVAAPLYWYAPVKLLMHDKFKNIDKIASVDSPVLIIHGDKDKLIPMSHSVRLSNKVQTNKQFNIYKDVTHNDVPLTRVAEDIIQFIKN